MGDEEKLIVQTRNAILSGRCGSNLRGDAGAVLWGGPTRNPISRILPSCTDVAVSTLGTRETEVPTPRHRNSKSLLRHRQFLLAGILRGYHRAVYDYESVCGSPQLLQRALRLGGGRCQKIEGAETAASRQDLKPGSCTLLVGDQDENSYYGRFPNAPFSGRVWSDPGR